MSRLPLLLVVTALTTAAPAIAQGAAKPFTVVETGKSYWRLDDAVNSMRDRDATIRVAPGTYKDCAIQESGRLALIAEQPGTVIIEGVACEDKAALVLRGRETMVEGITFRGIRVPDGNGAGIRLEKGNLTIRNSAFRDSEEGILTADDPASSITIDHSTFSGLGRCDRGLSCAHSVYIGHYGSVTVTNSRFERGTGGHYFKSRAERNTVTNSSFDDAQGRTTNYMIDLCAGSVGRIAGNIFVQGPNKENHSAFITVAAEARENPSQGLQIADNTARLAPGVTWPTVFVADWSHEPLAIGTNQLAKGIKAFETR